MFEAKRILVLAPHTDDEMGCGGAVAKLARQGAEVFYVAFSAAEESVPKEFPRDILRSEAVDAAKCIGIRSENVEVSNYQVRRFCDKRQNILDDMIVYRNTIKPDLVFLPSVSDIHQDHGVIAIEGIRAFKKINMFAYEVPWNHLEYKGSAFVNLTEQDLEAKISAVECYKSQGHRDYINGDYIRSLAVVRGTQVGAKYAESFEVVRCHIS